MTAQSAASAAYIVAALLFILASPGCPSTRRPAAGNTFGIAGMAIALVATLVLALAGGLNALQLALLIDRHGRRRSHRPVARRPGAR